MSTQLYQYFIMLILDMDLNNLSGKAPSWDLRDLDSTPALPVFV